MSTDPPKPKQDCPFGATHMTVRAFREDTKRRIAKGERQVKCITCRRWRWADEAIKCRQLGGGFVPLTLVRPNDP